MSIDQYVKREKRPSRMNSVTVYLKESNVKDLLLLKENKINVSMVCREAIKHMANRIRAELEYMKS